MKYTLTISTDDPRDIIKAIGGVPAGVDVTVPAPGLAGALGATQTTASVVPADPTDTDDDGPTNDTPPELDARGYPWDERIHASSKALNKDGTWRYRRNTEQSLIETVEAELKAITDIKIGDTPVPADTVVTVPTPLETAIDATPVPVPVPVPVSVSVPVPDAEPNPLDIPPSLQRTAVTYEQAIAQITEALNNEAHPLTAARVPELYTALGVSGPHELPGNQEALDAVAGKLAEMQ